MSWFSDYAAARAIDIDTPPTENEEAFRKIIAVLDAVHEYLADQSYLGMAADMKRIMETLKEDRDMGIIPK